MDLGTIRQIIGSVGRILCVLEENGLRHCNLRPENILINNRDPLELLLTGFQYSCLSTFELNTITLPISARYTAPEIIAGGVSVASDWWSLGMVILELLTKGKCFDGINEQAFRIHIVTRGISLPKGIDPSLNLLLRGLLTRNPDLRWQWTQVQKWLAGETVAAIDIEPEEIRSGPILELKGRSYVCPNTYALAAAEAVNWEEAKDLFMRGVVATWLESRKIDPKIIAGVRVAASIDTLSIDLKHALALMWINSDLPLIYQGEIVTSGWLLQHYTQGYEILTGPLVGYFRQMGRENYLCELHDRIKKARIRAKSCEIELDEECFRIFALVSSHQKLELDWIKHRHLFPGSDHIGLNALMDCQEITDDELIILLGAKIDQYQSAEQILNQTNNIALQSGLASFDRVAGEHWFNVSRNQIYREIEERIVNYSRCGIARIDDWADDFRIQKRLSLSRSLILLSVPKELWKEPDRLQYVSRILEFYEKRAVILAQRGPLVRMVISKSSLRIDLAGVSGNKPAASVILEHLISRAENAVGIDKIAFKVDINLEKKLRHLVSYSNTYRRDTGIDSLYLGFPFLIIQDGSPIGTGKKPKIAPILLWPIKIDIEARDENKITIRFDHDREEVRLNPSLAVLIEADIKKWTDATTQLLERSSIRTAEVMDVFGALAQARERVLCPLPSKDYIIEAGNSQVVCSAVLFHAKFMGQALLEDLRQMQKKPAAGTGLETLLQVNKNSKIDPPEPSSIPEKERYFTTESDPYQEKAVLDARQSPGLLIEGPPGTGKSQTIVNIIGDHIGRGQTVLVICQKSAALEVLVKRLEAEGFQDRFFYITDVNKDRASVIQSIRTQIDGSRQCEKEYLSEKLEEKRDELAEKIEKLESEIDAHYKAIDEVDDITGLSYRDILGELIDLEDYEVQFVDVPALRSILSNYNQKELSEIEDICAPIAEVWLYSSFEGSPLANLKAFSSDAALINEFKASFSLLIKREESRNTINLKSNTTLDLNDPRIHQEWIKSYDKLLKKVDWEKISSWAHLFSPNGQFNGLKIIKHLEELREQLMTLALSKHDQILSTQLLDIPISTLEEWLPIAKKIEQFNSICFLQYDSFKKQLEDLKEHLNTLEINKYDQNLSGKLIEIPLSVIEEWQILIKKTRIFNPSCFTQYGIFKIQLEELKQQLNTLPLNNQDQIFSNKLVETSMPSLKRWLSLTKKITEKKSMLGFLNPLRFIRHYWVKNILSKFNLFPNLETIMSLKAAMELEKKQRPIREAVLLFLKMVYQDSETKKPLFSKDLNFYIDLMIEDLSYVDKLRKIFLDLKDELTFENYKQFQNACELEIKLHPVRKIFINIYGKIYQKNNQLKSLNLENLNFLIEHALEGLINVTKIKQILINLGENQNFERAIKFKDAADLERDQRPIRIEILKYLEILYQSHEISRPVFLKDLISVNNLMIENLTLVRKGMEALHACPLQKEVESLLKLGLSAYMNLISRYEEAFERYQARLDSMNALDRLFPFFSEYFFNECKTNIREDESNLAGLHVINDSLPSLIFYQDFRIHARNLTPEVLKIFSILREKDKDLKMYPIKKIAEITKRIITREARLAWKARIEEKSQNLRILQQDTSRKIKNLDHSSLKMQKLNQKLIAFKINIKKVTDFAKDWEDLTRLRGQRVRRLREIIERGWDIGLMELRPVWLMNPDTASQLLPLKEGMFDLIIFDEASQIPIEKALPTLYRARRVIVSGDEKQMPPTNVFMKRLNDDEEGEFDEDENQDEMSVSEWNELEDTKNSQEIKGYSDLLSLGKKILPRSMLQIHYRSKYRELIEFSNAAFYNNKLNIPIRHPEKVIHSIRPIETIRVDGVYVNQTNKSEAEKIVNILAKIWDSPNCPSIGVVTFNAKQANLIEDLLEERAKNDLNFRRSLISERERQQEGEDMSFFVKNVENVQGDERDIIIFSSTFGRDEKGIFRRSFGLLGQKGGEYRLNVAVSRAREKMIVVTSLPIDKISESLRKKQRPKNPRDYLQAYFDYAFKVSEGSLDLARKSLNRMASENPIISSSFGKDEFVRSVATFIRSLDLKILFNKENDIFDLDLIIEDPQKKHFVIGIECDAPCHPILKTARIREIWRPKVLSKAIPHVHRITSYAWFHQRKTEMERLKRLLEDNLGIILTEKFSKLGSEEKV